MRGKSTTLILAGMVALLLAGSPAWSDALSSTITDPVGDSGGFAECGGVSCSAHQDIVQAQIAKRGGMFVLGMTVAEPIPENPSLSPGVKQITWAWYLDTNPETFPIGYPFPFGQIFIPSAEFVVWIVWDGRQFTGQLIDRRPLLTGGGAVLSSIPFKVKGTELTAVVDDSLITDPSSFTWFSFTGLYNAVTEQGNYGYFFVDFTPDAPWPM